MNGLKQARPDTDVLIDEFTHFRTAGQLGPITAALLAVYFPVARVQAVARASPSWRRAPELEINSQARHVRGQREG